MKSSFAESLIETRPGQAIRMKPKGMDRASATPEQVAAIQRIALSIFTDMSNAGYSLRETLAAIYLTGAQNTIAVLQDGDSDIKQD